MVQTVRTLWPERVYAFLISQGGWKGCAGWVARFSDKWRSIRDHTWKEICTFLLP